MSGDVQHPRREIRDSVFAILKEKVPNIISFSKNRFRPIWQSEELPGLGVYTLQETSEVLDEAPRRLKRTLTLAVEVVVQGDEKLDDTLDEICLDVENAIHVDETLNCKVSDCRLVSTDLIQKPEGDTLTGSAILNFEAVYFTYAPDVQNLRPYKGADFAIERGVEDAPTMEGTANVDAF